MAVQMMPFGAGLDASLRIGQEIGARDGRAAWLAASYPMTQGAFVLIGGRFGDVFGHKNVLLGGAVWWVVWSLVSGFAKSIVTLSLFRGLTGMGGAFIVPNAVALIAHTFPPGRLRNIAMGSFGAMAPIGGKQQTYLFPSFPFYRPALSFSSRSLPALALAPKYIANSLQLRVGLLSVHYLYSLPLGNGYSSFCKSASDLKLKSTS